MATVEIVAPLDRGNGHSRAPLSRKAFLRGLPRRVGTIEDILEQFEQQFDTLKSATRSDPVTVTDPALAVRVDNIVEIVGQLEQRLRLVERRSLRSRRKLAVITDQVAAQFE